MQQKGTIIPPQVTIFEDSIFATQGDTYALDIHTGEIKQSYALKAWNGPTVTADTFYVHAYTVENTQIQAIHISDGDILWKHELSVICQEPPCLYEGKVYTAGSSSVYAFEARDGKLIWQYEIAKELLAFFAAPLVANNILYIVPGTSSSLEPHVYALNAVDGTLLWKVKLPGYSSYPLALADNTLFITTFSDDLALDANDGTKRWEYRVEAVTRKSRRISGHRMITHAQIDHGVVYVSYMIHYTDFTDFGKPVYWNENLVDARNIEDGTQLWQCHIGTTTSGFAPSRPVIQGNILYLHNGDGNFYALRSDNGETLWQFHSEGANYSEPIVVNEKVYVGVNNGYVYALDALNGSLVWQTFVSTTANVIVGSDVISVGDGTLNIIEPNDTEERK